MKSPYYARLVAKLLSRAAERQAERRPVARATAILQIEAALRKKSLRQRQARWATALALGSAIAAASALWVTHASSGGARPTNQVSAIASPIGPGAQLSNASGSAALRGESALLPGNRLLAGAAGSARLRLSTGTEITVEHGANLTFSDAGPTERFVLSSGELQAKVAKLRPGQRFIVETPDSEVEVHGTVFVLRVVELEPDCVAAGRTRLEVREGVVEVRAHGTASYVHPGETWPSPCPDRQAASAPTASAEAATVLPSAKPGPMPGSARSAPAPASSSKAADTPSAVSLTKLQNELFARAVRARRMGDDQAALQGFEELSNTFPSSPLAESAAAQRMRLLAHADPAAAVSAARDYLRRYPHGFAASDAAAILKR